MDSFAPVVMLAVHSCPSARRFAKNLQMKKFLLPVDRKAREMGLD